jgi:F-type H+-transporting ATPase subunit b
MLAEPAKYEDAATASIGMPQLDVSSWASQIFWLIICFAVLYFALSRFILPALRDTIATRSDRVADDLDSASRMQREAEEAEKAYNTSLRDARAKANNVAESTRRSIDEEVAAELAAADAEADSQAELAEARIKAIKAGALSKLDDVAADVATSLISELTGKSVPTKTVLAAVRKG